MSEPPPLLRRDMRRATVVLETAAHSIGDEFLQYLYEMAALHLEEEIGKRQRRGRPASNDPQDHLGRKDDFGGR